ncbi:MAG: transcription/translation regulatory transformer protein RfaH [Gammaproteobacteria bacterium]|nr:transcription/translation regulatory transformer protein RfaH [Gammaproteobacteria bacterium]
MSDRPAVAKSWYLVYTKPRREILAQENLDRQGYMTYLPLMRSRRRRVDRLILVTEPLFPRYLFVHLDAQTDNWAPIRSTLGVVGLVRFGPQPARAPDDLIDLLKSRDGPDGIQTLPMPDFHRGDAVRITEGTMAGYQGIFLAKSGRERVVILLEIAGRDARVQLSACQIEPAV